ncbi:MAG: NADP-dependent oxidoreductase [Ferruginibacter sp.]|nr:NADP-dependent oxidoreductase [Cytophagales bacterium]
MKAIVAERAGNPDVLVSKEMPTPIPQAGEVLIRIHATGVNPVDFKIRRMGFGLSFPLILGMDVAGTVAKTGSGAEEFAEGEEVIAKLDFAKQGGYAEYATVSVERVIKKPAAVSFEEGAGIPVAALTAWQALFEPGHLQAGQRVLIHAAAGGVGTFAVQFAKRAGAYVIGTASAENHDFLRELGADEVIDYRKQKFYEVASEIDLVFDAAGNEESLGRSADVLKKGGTVVSIVGKPVSPRIDSGEVKGISFQTVDKRDQLREITDLVASKEVRVIIDRVFPLAEAAGAHAVQEGGHVRGKLVLVV